MVRVEIGQIVRHGTFGKDHTMHRRTFVLAIAGFMSASDLGPRFIARESTPKPALADLGLPELDVIVSVSGFEGIPASIKAGRYLVNVTPGEDIEDMAGVGFIQPEGVSADEFLEIVLGAPPEGDSEAMMLPPIFHEATFAGGIYTPAGVTARIVLDLAPGEWMAWADDPAGTQRPLIFEATGDMPADLVEPESIGTFTMGEYLIDLTAGALAAGPQVVKVENIGAQPHFLSANTVPAGTTAEQLGEVLRAEMNGSPVADSGLDPEVDFGPGFYTSTQSTGTAVWAVLNLEPGTYALLCHFPDLSDGMPHAYHGMYGVVDVGE